MSDIRSDISEYIRLGCDLVNQKVDVKSLMQDRPTDRTVLLRVCHPHEEVEQFIDNWLRLYINGELKEKVVSGTVEVKPVIEEVFYIWLNTAGEKWQVMCSSDSPVGATVSVYVPQKLFNSLATRVDTFWTAYARGEKIEVRSADGMDMTLRDLMHLDTLLGMINNALLARGINLAEVMR